MPDLGERFLVNARGRKTAVVIPLGRYRELLEDLHDLARIAGRRDEPTLSHQEVLERLKRDGLL